MPASSHRRKLARAEMHIEDVEAMLGGWFRDGYRTFEETNREGRFVLYAEQLEPLPDQLALAIGDALHCQRSSLDQLIFALSKAHSPKMTAKQENDSLLPDLRPGHSPDRSTHQASPAPHAPGCLCFGTRPRTAPAE